MDASGSISYIVRASPDDFLFEHSGRANRTDTGCLGRFSPVGTPSIFDLAQPLVQLELSRIDDANQMKENRQLQDVLHLRVRYSETDQMGTFYNSRALEWFECGRTELMRNQLKLSYSALEAKGVFLPLVEAHLEFQGGARYDDLLRITSTAEFSGRAKLRFEVQITQAETGRPVVSGYTVHAFTDAQAKPIRPPDWFVDLINQAATAPIAAAGAT
jgi:acyl-CoA thioester hydrolase